MVTKENENLRGWPLGLGRNNERTTGWPLGLGILNMTLRIVPDGNQNASVAEPCSLHIPSYSFSSFSSSNLDTESTTSFFPDQSVPLGRLIGMKPAGNKRRVFDANTNHFEQQSSVFHSRSYGEVKEVSSQKLCVPLLHNVIEKLTSRSRN
ncbi:hypothetical protein Leryth_023591 [Lithospermum erythrorhizon]|nr:hypothetical protein Leryth_023591 [Lithospermum erythrorhizon]